MSITAKTFHFFMILIFLAAFLNTANAAEFSGLGDGTENNPYQITTFSQLDEVRYDLSANYILMNDLDFNDFSGDWIPLGNSQDSDNLEVFEGIFDGNNKTIYNLTINTVNNNQGLFFCVAFEGKIINLNMENAKIIGNEYVGVIAGYIASNSSVINCRIMNSTVSASMYGGAVAGLSFESLIDSCSVINSSIASSYNSGGIVSENRNNVIKNSIVENTKIQSNGLVGGIAALNDHGSIIENSSVVNCSIKSETSAAWSSYFDSAGGISGWSIDGIITGCRASGEIISVGGAGGQVGGISGTAYNTTIEDCHSFSSVTSTSFGNVGGIAGYAEECRINNCSSLNSEINQFESFKSIRKNHSFFDYIFLKIEYNAGYIVGGGDGNQISDCVYSDKIESNKPIFKKSGSKKVNYVDDWTGFII